jgi:hypothetical protein
MLPSLRAPRVIGIVQLKATGIKSIRAGERNERLLYQRRQERSASTSPRAPVPTSAASVDLHQMPPPLQRVTAWGQRLVYAFLGLSPPPFDWVGDRCRQRFALKATYGQLTSKLTLQFADRRPCPTIAVEPILR